MIRTFLAALLFFCALATFATAAPFDDPGRDSAVTDSAPVSHASVTLDTRSTDAAPIGTSPMLASVGVLGVAGVVAGKSLLSFRPGDRVTYVDEAGVAHAALVKKWWGADKHAGCNLAYVDESESDSYGPLLRNVGSVSSHDGSSPGRYWQPADEPVTAEAAPIPAPIPAIGYRQLTPEDVELMNEVKVATNALGAVLDKLAAHPDTDKRAVSIAKTEAQTASMWASRAITRPSSFA